MRNKLDVIKELARSKLVRIIFIIIIILYFETTPGNKSFLSVKQNINQLMFNPIKPGLFWPL